MLGAKLERFVPLTGVLAIVLIVVGLFVASTDIPDDDAPATEWITYYDDQELTIFLGSGLMGLGVAAFIWFLGSLRGTLQRAEGGSGSLSAVSFGAGLGTAVLFAATAVPGLAGAAAFGYIDRDLSPEATETLSILEDGFFIVAFYLAFAFLVPTAVAMIRTRALPVWLGWVTLALGILILSPIGWIFFIFGLSLWTLLVSILLFLGGRAPTSQAVT